KDSIREGMFFTIEPGIYMIGRRGIRIEDDILIFNGKVECLTNVTKELIIIEKPKPYKSLYFKL
ncbi:MAG: M24 family metallopeptidase, partial [Candidatus Woesearchaeota archaeon]